MKAPTLRSFRLKNFKAVRDSGTIKLTPLTAFIGNNGSGKSSVIEAMETLQLIVDEGLDTAMGQWRGFEHIQHQGAPHTLKTPKEGREYYTNPISFQLRGRMSGQIKSFAAETEIRMGPGGDEIFFGMEKVTFGNWYRYTRNDRGRTKAETLKSGIPKPNKSSDLYPAFLRHMSGRSGLTSIRQFEDDESLIEESLSWFISEWQFLTLIPQKMGEPTPRRRTGGDIRLEKDGSNIAEYLLDIRDKDLAAFEGIIQTLQYVLPYARDLQPALTSELERAVYLQLTEGTFKVPGWLLSTGTLRLLAILALLRHPTPPPVIIIEEIENGLDPRTINLVVDEIRNAVESGITQVILTTHSPYLLDLLTLSHIVFVERIDDQPTFTRPEDQESLKEWTEKFGPGRLYTMDLLSGEKGK